MEQTGAVSRLPDNHHVCIVSSTKDLAGFDMLTSRLLALSLDSMLTKEIHTV